MFSKLEFEFKNAREKFNFDDFTEDKYEKILLSLKNKGYESKFYFETVAKKESKKVLLRHDIDCSPQRNLALANIEAKHGFKSHFFVLLHSEFYNTLEIEITNIIKKIANLGHEIGLHFDPTYYTIKTDNDLFSKMKFEKNILEEILGMKIKSFSWHIPTLHGIDIKDITYCDMINVYSEFFKENFKYCSDSNGYWRFSRMQNFVDNLVDENIHLLTHGEWWTKEVMSPRKKIIRATQGRFEKSVKNWDSFIKNQNDRYNIDDESVDKYIG